MILRRIDVHENRKWIERTLKTALGSEISRISDGPKRFNCGDDFRGHAVLKITAPHGASILRHHYCTWFLDSKGSFSWSGLREPKTAPEAIRADANIVCGNCILPVSSSTFEFKHTSPSIHFGGGSICDLRRRWVWVSRERTVELRGCEETSRLRRFWSSCCSCGCIHSPSD